MLNLRRLPILSVQVSTRTQRSAQYFAKHTGPTSNTRTAIVGGMNVETGEW
jgi:hypothetical protein